MVVTVFKSILREFYEEPLVGDVIARDITIPLDTHMILSVMCTSIKDSDTRIREVEGLLQAVKRTGAAKALIITLDEEDSFEEQGVIVQVQPALKWFLQKEK